jgi:hypothetical protein
MKHKATAVLTAVLLAGIAFAARTLPVEKKLLSPGKTVTLQELAEIVPAGPIEGLTHGELHAASIKNDTTFSNQMKKLVEYLNAQDDLVDALVERVEALEKQVEECAEQVSSGPTREEKKAALKEVSARSAARANRLTGLSGEAMKEALEESHKAFWEAGDK